MPLKPEHDPVSSGARKFVTTHWSAVLSAGGADSPQAQKALAELCQAYWYPLYAYIRRTGYSPHDAEDMTQGFFAKLLEKNFLADAKQEKGRFRSFLLIALKRFMANQWDRANAEKRGGGKKIIPFDKDSAETRYGLEPVHNITPSLLFEQEWATTLLDKVLRCLASEYTESDRGSLFEELRPSLVKDDDSAPYSEIARKLETSEAAVKMAVRRMRARYCHLLREEIAKTVANSDEIEDEIQHLYSIFSS